MDLADALAIHGRLLKEAVTPNVTTGAEGKTFIGMAIGLELAHRSPDKADKLREVLTTMRDGVLGYDRLWADVVDAMEPILEEVESVPS